MKDILQHNYFNSVKILYLFPVFYAFALPFQNPLPNIIIILWTIYVLVKGNHRLFLKNIKRNPSILLFPLLFVLNLISLFFSIDLEHGLKKLETKASILLIPLLLQYIPLISKRFIRDIFRSFTIGIISSLLICIISFNWHDFNSNRLLYVNFSHFMHTSYFSMYICVAMAGLLFFPFRPLPYQSLSKNNYFKWAIIPILSIVVFLLSSKAGIIAMFLLFSLKGFNVLEWKNKSHLIALAASILIIGLISINNPRVKSVFIFLEKTIKNEPTNVTESNTLRIAIWQEAYSLFTENLWTGEGVGDADKSLVNTYKQQPKKYRHLIELELNAHNSFLQEGINAGVFSFATLISIIIGILWSKKYPLLSASFFILFFVNFLTESMLEKIAGVSLFAFFYPLLYLMQSRMREE